MCYVVYLSTTSKDPLRDDAGGRYLLQPVTDADTRDIVDMLAYPNKASLICRYGGCSCHLRHLPSPELGFGPPEEWYEEDDDDIESTAAFYDLVESLVKQGHRFDLIDIYEGVSTASVVKQLKVSLKDVPRESFRFFENYRFDFVP